jgi:hypothetical protein
MDTTVWRTSRAKSILRDAILAGAVKEGDDVNLIYQSNPEYLKWPLKNFKVNLKSLFKAVAKDGANPKVEQWKNSKAKWALRDSIIAGIVKATDRPEQVYISRPEYQQYAYPNFKTNLKKLIAAVALDYQRMAVDEDDYRHDIELLTEYRRRHSILAVPWHKSNAKALLGQDMDAGKHSLLRPAELWAGNAEYQQFPLKVFRDHMYTEQKKRDNKGVRFQGKKKRLPKAPKISNEVGRSLQK